MFFSCLCRWRARFAAQVGLTVDSIVAKVRTMLGEIFAIARLTDAAREAHRRDRKAAKRLRAEGWTIDEHGDWRHAGNGGHLSDGPGTADALAAHFNAIVADRGLQEDVALVGSGVRRLIAAAAARVPSAESEVPSAEALATVEPKS